MTKIARWSQNKSSASTHSHNSGSKDGRLGPRCAGRSERALKLCFCSGLVLGRCRWPRVSTFTLSFGSISQHLHLASFSELLLRFWLQRHFLTFLIVGCCAFLTVAILVALPSLLCVYWDSVSYLLLFLFMYNLMSLLNLKALEESICNWLWCLKYPARSF